MAFNASWNASLVQGFVLSSRGELIHMKTFACSFQLTLTVLFSYTFHQGWLFSYSTCGYVSIFRCPGPVSSDQLPERVYQKVPGLIMFHFSMRGSQITDICFRAKLRILAKFPQNFNFALVGYWVMTFFLEVPLKWVFKIMSLGA